ncbi:esterase-like activity of phytase family protein [Rhodobacteraceae bacterium NNCM2]|nr:esterase-like activity of phytase family protein [Coraliihabitans acroporae]
MRNTAVLIGLAAVTAALMFPGPPIGILADRFAGGSAAQAGEAADLKPVIITATPVEVPATHLTGLTPAGAWHLTGDNEWFGGLSGLMIEGDEMIAVSDKAHLLRARIGLEGDELSLNDATLWHLRDSNDYLLDHLEGDAESIAYDGDDLMISFERDHRIERFGPDGRLSDPVEGLDFSDLNDNGGIEAMVTLPDGRLLALAETWVDGASLVWLIRDGKVEQTARLPLTSKHLVTGAALDGAGRLYLSQRHYSPTEGVSIRIKRYALDGGLPVAESEEVIAAWENDSGIDNMEGLDITTGPEGEEIMWFLSDDNFNQGQRTLLMRFVVEGGA